MKNKLTKIMAAIALFCIILSIIWTWLIVIFSSTTTPVELTPEQIEQVQQAIEDQQAESGDVVDIEDILSNPEDSEETK